MRCSATIRYARRCSRTAYWMVDGEPMCGHHANKREANECVPLTQWSGTCTGAYWCPAAVHFEGCYSHPPATAADLPDWMDARQERFGS